MQSSQTSQPFLASYSPYTSYSTIYGREDISVDTRGHPPCSPPCPFLMILFWRGGKSSNDPSDLISAIHVFSFLEKEVLELLSTSVIIESFMNEMELNKILDTNDLVILKEGRISAHHDNTLIGYMKKGRLLSSLLNLLCSLTNVEVDKHPRVILKVLEGGSVLRIPMQTITTELRELFPLNTSHLIQLIVSKFLRATLGFCKIYDQVMH